MDENQIPKLTSTSQTSGLKEQFTTVTSLSKFLAMILFVALPFIGFWFGLQFKKTDNIEYGRNIENPTPIDTQAKPAESQTPITASSSEKTLNNENVSEGYRIVSPKAGDTFQEDEPITVVWQPFNELENIYVFLIPDNCSDKICDEIYGGEMSIDLLKSYLPAPYVRSYIPNKGFLTISLPEESPVVAYPPGKYRIVLLTEYTRNTPHQTLLVQSDPFTITIPADRTRMLGEGDKLGDFIITSMSTNRIATKGSTTISGVYYFEKILGSDCFEVTREDAWKIPRMGSDYRSPWFCFSNDISDELRQSVSTTTVEIENYYIDLRQMETADGADFVRIIH